MAFDEKFLQDRARKQQDWAKRGVRSGSGKPFSTTNFAGGFGGGQPDATGSGRIKKNGSKAKSGLFELSPHAKALAELAKNPTLRTGGMVNGKKRKANHEHYEQVILFDWIHRHLNEYYDDFTANPMGGLRDNKTAGELYAEGVKAGYPDITFDYPSGVYYGMRIELKYGKNKPSDAQVKALRRKTELGYFCCVCYGWEECKEAILEYIALSAGGLMAFNKNEKTWKEAA